jgi:hypothetical protein
MRALTAARTAATLAERYSRPPGPRWPFTALRIRFFARRLAEPFLTLGISAFLKESLFFSACWRQLITGREASLQLVKRLWFYFRTYLPKLILIVLAVAPVKVAGPPIRLRRLALLPLIR